MRICWRGLPCGNCLFATFLFVASHPRTDSLSLSNAHRINVRPPLIFLSMLLPLFHIPDLDDNETRKQTWVDNFPFEYANNGEQMWVNWLCARVLPMHNIFHTYLSQWVLPIFSTKYANSLHKPFQFRLALEWASVNLCRVWICQNRKKTIHFTCKLKCWLCGAHSLVTIFYSFGCSFIVARLPKRITSSLQKLIVAVMWHIWTTFVLFLVVCSRFGTRCARKFKGRLRLDYDDLEHRKKKKKRTKKLKSIRMQTDRVHCCIMYCLRSSSFIASQRALSFQFDAVKITVRMLHAFHAVGLSAMSFPLSNKMMPS